jgi:hypothetical protein
MKGRGFGEKDEGWQAEEHVLMTLATQGICHQNNMRLLFTATTAGSWERV